VSGSSFRQEALEALYAAEANNAREPDVDGLRSRAARLAIAVWAERERLDDLLREVATGWRVERMPAIDRNILRIGAWELAETDTPVGVVLSEAVELAKRFSTARSGRFVNGVLAALVPRLRPTGGADDRRPAAGC